MNITLNWSGFLFAIIFVLFFMGTVALIGLRSLMKQEEQKKGENEPKDSFSRTKILVI